MNAHAALQAAPVAGRALPLDLRQRIYAHYLEARPNPAAVASVASFEPRAKYLKLLIERFFPASRDAEILELGCGHGALLHFARLKGYRRLEGVDRSSQQLNLARRLGLTDVREEDLLRALQSTADASKDVVITFDVIEHFARDELLPLVDEVHRVLRAGGRWIIHVPNGDSPMFGRVRYGDITHELAFTRISLSQLLLASGFSNVDCLEDKPMGRSPFVSACRRMLWAGIRGLLLTYIAAETGVFDRTAIFSQNFLAVATREN